MISGSEWFLEPHRAILADRHEAICKTDGIAAAHAIEALAHGFGHGCRHALTGEPRQLPSQPVRLLAFDIQTHRDIPFLPLIEPFYLHLGPRQRSMGTAFHQTRLP